MARSRPTRSSAPSGGCAATVRLSELPAGSVARFHAATVSRDDRALLRALGLTEESVVRVCKAGEPCIVEVRTTRIGLSRTVADALLVIPESAT